MPQKCIDVSWGTAVDTDHSSGARVAAQSRLAASIGPKAPIVNVELYVRWLLFPNICSSMHCMSWLNPMIDLNVLFRTERINFDEQLCCIFEIYHYCSIF